MPQLNTITAWVHFLTGLISALENGQVAVSSLEGKTLPEMVEISKQGWDKFDEAIAEAKRTE